MTQFLAPSSYGEALDRLTILQLKLDFIQDKRRDDVRREFDDLYELVKDLIAKDTFHYMKLLEVNRIMWQIQDILHEGKTQDKEHEYNLMKQLAVENQRRFRLKRTINENLGSRHKEQKGYKGKRAFVLSHQGMGDYLFLNGAVRYLATFFDEVCVVVKEQYKNNMVELYKDEPAVSFYTIQQDKDISPLFGCPFEWFQQVIAGYDFVGLCGYHKQLEVNDFPRSFYSDLGIPVEALFSWSSLPLGTTDIPSEPYTVLHSNSSNTEANIPIDLDQQLVLNPSKNMYPEGHKWHGIAQKWAGLPMLQYTSLLKHAQTLKMVDSSFFCMSLLLGKLPEVWCRNGRTYTNIAPALVEHPA